MPPDSPAPEEIDLNQLNQRFKQAYAIAKAIPKRKNKRAAILAWCKAAKKALGG